MNIGNLFALNGKIVTEALSVACVQFAPIGAQSVEELNENTETVLHYLDLAVSAFPGVDLVVFPEACFQGFPPVGFQDALLQEDSPQVQRVLDRCRALSVWSVINPLIRAESEKCFLNTAFVVNDKGEIVHRYVKMNPWIPFENAVPGSECTVCDGPKGSRLGVIICADGDYPEIWREAAYRGANVIIRPTHYMDPWYQAWELTNRASAYFNQVYVVGANCSGLAKNEARSCFGRSMIVGPDGNIITEASNGCPGLIKADLYPGIIDQMRAQAVHSNPLYSFRHRGASCPELGGKGDPSLGYSAYREQEEDLT